MVRAMRARQREHGRGERVLPGLWRLRLPLPWPGVPHGNAWAIAAGDGIVLVDTGVHGEDSLAELERAMDQVGLSLEQVDRLLITHAHEDHWGQARPVVQASGAEVWIHPAHRITLRRFADLEAEVRWRVQTGRRSGGPEEPLRELADRTRESARYFAGPVSPGGDLVNGVRVATDLGEWQVHETPGHAVSHVCLHQPELRLLISGDHLLGRIALWFDRGDTADPIAEYLDSLDVIAGLRARLALSGHGKPFLDVPGHIEGSRRAVLEQLEGTVRALADGPRTAMQVAAVNQDDRNAGAAMTNSVSMLPITLCLLEHLELAGRVARESDGGLDQWHALATEAPNLDTLVSR